MTSLPLAAILLSLAPVAWAGTNPPGAGASPARGNSAAKSAAKPAAGQSAQSDAKLEAAIRAKFAQSKIGADKFTVHVQGGVATIEGHTDVIQHKGTATRMAKTAGAAAVNNHVQISDAAKAKAAGNLESGRRRVQVKRGDPRTEQKPSR